MVVEENYVGKQDIPALQAIGWEGLYFNSFFLRIYVGASIAKTFKYVKHVFAGIFGIIGISLALIPLNYIAAPPPFADNSRGTLEASLEALIEIGNSSRLLIAVIGQFYFVLFRVSYF